MVLPNSVCKAFRSIPLFYFLVFGVYAEAPTSPPELVEFFETATAARKETIGDVISEKLSALNGNYEAALQRAGKTAQLKGDLEAAVLVKSELERLAAGKPFDTKKEIALTSATQVVYTYEAELRKIAEEQEFLETEFAAKVNRGLDQLIADLTKSGRVEDALAVKKYGEGDAVAELVKGGAEAKILVGNSTAARAGPLSTDREMERKASSERILPGDLPPGRIVFLPFETGQETPEVFEKIGTEDRTDIAMVGRTNFQTVGAIRSDGALVYWRYSSDPKIVPGTNVFCGQSYGLPLIGLDASGKLNATEDSDPAMMAAIQSQSGAVHIGITSGICAVSHSDGKIDVIGPRDDVANAVAIEAVSDAVDTAFSGAAFASVLRKDRSVLDFSNGKESQPNVRDSIVKLYGFRLGETERGDLLGWGAGAKPMLEKVGRNPRQVFQENKTFVAIGESGEFFISRKQANGGWEEVEGAGKALSGANSFAWLEGDGQEWLAVVLPADSVSRSGVWTLEELAAERSSR